MFMEGWQTHHNKFTKLWERQVELENGETVEARVVFWIEEFVDNDYKVTVNGPHLQYSDKFDSLEKAVEKADRVIQVIREVCQ